MPTIIGLDALGGTCSYHVTVGVTHVRRRTFLSKLYHSFCDGYQVGTVAQASAAAYSMQRARNATPGVLQLPPGYPATSWLPGSLLTTR